MKEGRGRRKRRGKGRREGEVGEEGGKKEEEVEKVLVIKHSFYDPSR